MFNYHGSLDEQESKVNEHRKAYRLPTIFFIGGRVLPLKSCFTNRPKDPTQPSHFMSWHFLKELKHEALLISNDLDSLFVIFFQPQTDMKLD